MQPRILGIIKSDLEESDFESPEAKGSFLALISGNKPFSPNFALAKERRYLW